MVQFKPSQPLPARSVPVKSRLTEQDLPDTDNQPVDNELQILLPMLLRAILTLAWANRSDWFLGANLGVYYDPSRPAVGPDALLSLGVPLYRPNEDLRLSYVIWQEGVVPQWVLEIVSKKPGKEYDKKMKLYAQLGVSYYTIYNPKHHKRDKHDPFEVYKLMGDKYVRQSGNPVWMPEIGLGIGVDQGVHSGLPQREWLYWYDEQGNRYPASENVVETAREEVEAALQREADIREEARQEAEAARQREATVREEARQEVEAARQREANIQEEARQQVNALLQKLRDRGIDPNTL